MQDQFERFVADEGPAIDELREFVGGELTRGLDESFESLELLDHFLDNLTAVPGWEDSPLFPTLQGRSLRPWLTVRVSYYLARVIRKTLGGTWHLDGDEPVLDVSTVRISPLEIAHSLLTGEIEGGLVAFYADLSTELARRNAAE